MKLTSDKKNFESPMQLTVFKLMLILNNYIIINRTFQLRFEPFSVKQLNQNDLVFREEINE